MGSHHRAVEHLNQMRGLAGLGQQLEECLKYAGPAEPPEPLPDTVPIAVLPGQSAPGNTVNSEKVQRFQKLAVIVTRLAASNTSSTMDQSFSVIPVSMAGSLLPDTHRFEEKVIREYPTRNLVLSVHRA